MIHWSAAAFGIVLYLVPFVVIAAMSHEPLYVLLGVGLFAVLMASVSIHELAHMYAARYRGRQSYFFYLWWLGGMSVYSAHPTSPDHLSNAIIAVAGPMVHIPLTLLFLAVSVAAHHGGAPFSPPPGGAGTVVACLWADYSWVTQLILMGVNLLMPAYPLDCSKIAVAVLMLRGMEPNRVATLVAYSTFACGGLVVLVEVALVATSGFSVGAFAPLVFVAFLVVSGLQLLRLARAGAASSHPLFRPQPPPAAEPQKWDPTRAQP